MMTGYAIDWTAYADALPERENDPFHALHLAKPYRDLPSGTLGDYSGTRFDLFTAYLPRRGFSLDMPVRAYTCKRIKVLETDSMVYLSSADDGVIHEIDKRRLINQKNSLIGDQNAFNIGLSL